MGDSVAISVQNVSKKYRLFNSPKERLWETLHPFNKKYHREFWALKEIDFQIPKGATVGIIGRNGSGKSTLLKIICSVLRPTSGEVKVNGKISSLLGLGAAFNPKFTGRENVMLNGALMGFSADDMKERMPLIESFADIGQFIDQPAKVYSSGMYARLAFSVAIHVDPDILVIDEVLAVGDAKFRQKCYQKFHEFQNEGKTIVIVTHDSGALVKHCNQAILLDHGNFITMGKPKDVHRYYVDLLEGRKISKEKLDLGSVAPYPEKSKTSSQKNSQPDLERFLEESPNNDKCHKRKSYNKNEYRQGIGFAEILDYLVVCEDKYDPMVVCSGNSISIYIKARFHKAAEFPLFGFSIKTEDGLVIYALNSFYNDIRLPPVKKWGIIIAKFSVKLRLMHGDYFFELGVDCKEKKILRFTNLWTGEVPLFILMFKNGIGLMV